MVESEAVRTGRLRLICGRKKKACPCWLLTHLVVPAQLWELCRVTWVNCSCRDEQPGSPSLR